MTRTTPSSVAVIGAGLTGLTAAYRLQAAGCRVAAVAWGYTSIEGLALERPDWIVDGHTVPEASHLLPDRLAG